MAHTSRSQKIELARVLYFHLKGLVNHSQESVTYYTYRISHYGSLSRISAGSMGGMTAKEAVPTMISSSWSHSFHVLTSPACSVIKKARGW